MKTGKCSKYNSREIYKHSTVYSCSNFVISMFKQARLKDYVCAGCGYLETYVLKEEDLNKIKDK